MRHLVIGDVVIDTLCSQPSLVKLLQQTTEKISDKTSNQSCALL